MLIQSSFNAFGEYEISTLKQAFNIACVELLNGDANEGLRQLEYCYYDMRDYLGENNELTRHAEYVLKEQNDNPDELYTAYKLVRASAREVINELK